MFETTTESMYLDCMVYLPTWMVDFYGTCRFLSFLGEKNENNDNNRNKNNKHNDNTDDDDKDKKHRRPNITYESP